MRTEIPIFRQISLDTDLSGRELQVFWAACELLDIVDPRPMTLTQLEHTIEQMQPRRPNAAKPSKKPSRSTLSDALSRLECEGYLVRTVADDGRVCYRVPLSRVVAAKVSPDAIRRRSSGAPGVVSEAFG